MCLKFKDTQFDIFNNSLIINSICHDSSLILNTSPKKKREEKMPDMIAFAFCSMFYKVEVRVTRISILKKQRKNGGWFKAIAI